jgi:hypothetical protein
MHSTETPRYNHDGTHANTGNSLKKYPCSHSYHHDGQYNSNFPEGRLYHYTEGYAQIMDNAMFVDKFTLSTLTQSKFVNKHSQFIQLQKTLGIKKNDGNDDVDDNGVPMAKF